MSVSYLKETAQRLEGEGRQDEAKECALAGIEMRRRALDHEFAGAGGEAGSVHEDGRDLAHRLWPSGVGLVGELVDRSHGFTVPPI